MRPYTAMLLMIGLWMPVDVPANELPRCLFISSYHVGYPWSDGIEAAVYSQLERHCQLRSAYLDSKRQPQLSEIQAQALRVKSEIEHWQPHILIAADDNASKFLIQPFYRDSKIPVVFCGVNWSVEEYGYPYRNATGMVEVMPINTLLNLISLTVPNARTGVFISADVITEQKDFDRYKKVFLQKGIELVPALVSSYSDWEKAYKAAQSYDFIILNNNAGIEDWEHQQAKSLVLTKGRAPAFTVYEWMMPYATIGVTKDPKEQGEWSAKVATYVLDGGDITAIPIIPNRRWNMWRNDRVAKQQKFTLPVSLKMKFRPYE